MRPKSPSTSATGGSAASQAATLDARVWTPKRWVSWLLQTVMFLAPLAVGFVAVAAAIQIVSRPDGLAITGGWIVLLIAVSTAGANVTRRFTVQLAPLSALFRLSLVFPDEAPSRFATALRARNGRHLATHAAAGDGSDQLAAEQMITLLATLSRHDRLTRGHSERVRAYSVMLGEEVGLSRAELDKLNWAALIHDIGKLDVPETILNKDGRPTSDEWDVLRAHPAAAAAYVGPLKSWLGEWVDAATQHHERWDGTGYPAGLAGTDISRAGRIVAIADAFDVMTATRSYKAPLPAEQARAELLNCAGSQFDPTLVRAFLNVSLGRMRSIAGPLAWLSHFPDLVRTPLTAAANGGHAVVAAGAVTVAATTGVIAPSTPEPDVAEAAVERVVVEPETPTTGDSGEPGGVPPDTVEPPAGEEPPPVTVPGATSSTTTTTTLDPDTTQTTAPLTTAPTSTASTSTTTSSTTTTSTSTTTTSTSTSTTTTSTTTTVPAGTTAVDDDVTITKSTTSVLLVTHNDDFGSSTIDSTSLELIDLPSRGAALVVGINLIYIPDPGETTGTDSVRYQICAEDGSCDTATVTITLDIS